MSPVGYFIGGPLGLTKMALSKAEPRMYALSPPALTLDDVSTAQEYNNVSALLDERHVHHRHSTGPGGVMVYFYVGQEKSRKP